jgi:hypothetical protein
MGTTFNFSSTFGGLKTVKKTPPIVAEIVENSIYFDMP